MFEIEYKGGNSVWLHGKDVSLVVDGNLASIGLKQPKLPKAAVQLATEKRFLIVDGAEDILSLEGPGEYEVGPFSIRGIAAQRHIDTEFETSASTLYRVEVGDVSVGIIGNIATKLSDEQLEGLGVVDILIIPVGGGGYTLDSVDAAKITRNIEPKAVIPVHFATNGIDYEVPQESLDVFTKELGAPVETVSKYKLKNSTALPAALTIYALEVA